MRKYKLEEILEGLKESQLGKIKSRIHIIAELYWSF